jgi:hypothetical protein
MIDSPNVERQAMIVNDCRALCSHNEAMRKAAEEGFEIEMNSSTYLSLEGSVIPSYPVIAIRVLSEVQ